jgi:hypothetical protein
MLYEDKIFDIGFVHPADPAPLTASERFLFFAAIHCTGTLQNLGIIRTSIPTNDSGF